MEVKFDKKFEEVLEEESKGFGIDWSLVEIKYIRYHFALREALPIKLDEYMVRVRVVEVEHNISEMEIDNWFRTHNFIYGIRSKSVRTESEESDIMIFDIGTIESIAMKIRDAFRDSQGQLDKKTLFSIDDDSWDFVEVPPTPLLEFMQTAFGITGEAAAIDRLNQIQSQAYGDLDSDVKENGEWLVFGKMYNPQKREICEEAFWNIIDMVEDIRSTDEIKTITMQRTVQQLSSELGVPESMFRHVFRVLAFNMCGGSSSDMPYCNQKGYFVFPKPIGLPSEILAVL